MTVLFTPLERLELAFRVVALAGLTYSATVAIIFLHTGGLPLASVFTVAAVFFAYAAVHDL